jgi:Tfp pilus assembly protein PilN
MLKARKRKRVPRPKGETRRLPGPILIALMVLLLVAVGIAYIHTSSSLDQKIRMNRRQKSYLIDQLSKVEKDLEEARKELEGLSKFDIKRVEWFGKLIGLSKTVPDDLWLTDLSIKTTKKRKRESREVERETHLIIKGATGFAGESQPLNRIAQLISSLNSLESFQRDFEPVTLVSTQLSRKKDREFMEFEISSKLKLRHRLSKREVSK